LFGLSIVVWMMLTLFESALVGMPPSVERLITLLGLVLPAGIGGVLGAISLIRRERPPWLAVLSLILNTLFALFQLLVILFAG
jgi:hypothetical protein